METQIITKKQSTMTMTVPSPKEAINFRPANTGDIDDIDKLQKQYSKALGFMPKAWLEGKIARNEVLIAESLKLGVGSLENDTILQTPNHKLQTNLLGYIIAQDRYLKRDELGIVYQLCVRPGKQRGFIGAALLKAQFDRSSPGCRLYCCWCAQDLEANHFWEAMGFYPLAFRNGADGKGKIGPDGKKKPRVQIFWQKKIRGNEDTYPWWFPAKTEAGAMGADRLALPIPPGVHWSEVEPIEIPVIEETKQLEGDCPQSPSQRSGGPRRPPSRKIERQPLMGGLRFAPVKPVEETKVEVEKPKRVRKPKVKIDPIWIRKAKDLRDQYLEHVNEKGYRLETSGKYELTRGIEVIPSKPILQIAA